MKATESSSREITSLEELTALELKFLTETILVHEMRDGRDLSSLTLWNDVLESTDISGRQISGLISSLVQKGVIFSDGEAIAITELGARLLAPIDPQNNPPAEPAEVELARHISRNETLVLIEVERYVDELGSVSSNFLKVQGLGDDEISRLIGSLESMALVKVDGLMITLTVLGSLVLDEARKKVEVPAGSKEAEPVGDDVVAYEKMTPRAIELVLAIARHHKTIEWVELDVHELPEMSDHELITLMNSFVHEGILERSNERWVRLTTFGEAVAEHLGQKITKVVEFEDGPRAGEVVPLDELEHNQRHTEKGRREIEAELNKQIRGLRIFSLDWIRVKQNEQNHLVAKMDHVGLMYDRPGWFLIDAKTDRILSRRAYSTTERAAVAMISLENERAAYDIARRLAVHEIKVISEIADRVSAGFDSAMTTVPISEIAAITVAGGTQGATIVSLENLELVVFTTRDEVPVVYLTPAGEAVAEQIGRMGLGQNAEKAIDLYRRSISGRILRGMADALASVSEAQELLNTELERIKAGEAEVLNSGSSSLHHRVVAEITRAANYMRKVDEGREAIYALETTLSLA